ncbi:MAG TPA: PKD domain-containing protein, partial [Humisphaera sp.]|nr:PKD domain-containing protein [Humisphaera sp.]
MPARAETLEQRLCLSVTWASVTPPSTGVVAGTSLAFGLQAVSNDGFITGWGIDFGDGQSAIIDGNPSSVSHTYSDPGTFSVNAVAYDGDDVGAPESPSAGAGLGVSQSLAVYPPSFTVNPTAIMSLQAGQTLPDPTVVGVIYGFVGNASDFTGTATLAEKTYDLDVSNNAGNLDLQISGTAPTTAGASTASINVTDNAGGFMAEATNTFSLAVSPAPFSINSSDLTLSQNVTLGATTVGTVSGFAGAASDYSGTLDVDGNTYGLNFTPAGRDLLVQCGGMYLLPGGHSASLSVTDSVDGLPTGASAGFSILALDPLTAGAAMGSDATVNVPWSGAVATAVDSASGATISATTNYMEGWAVIASGVDTTSPDGGAWTISDSETFTTGGYLDAHTSIVDSLGDAATADTYVNVTLPTFSVSAQSPSVVEGQAQDNVIIGTLSDGAGPYSVAGSYSATYSTPTGTSYAVTIVPDSPNDGNYNLTIDLPALASSPPMGTLYVNQSEGGQSNYVSVGVSLNFTPYNTLSVSEQAASIQYRQPGAVTIA